MSSTLVVQSCRLPIEADWIARCLQSVEAWAAHWGWDYRLLGDELFAPLPDDLLQRLRQQWVVATDLGRLLALQQGLAEGYQAVVWCDSDFLVFSPDELQLPANDYALGREVWVQHDQGGSLPRSSTVFSQ